MAVEVPVPPPFDADWLWGFLAARAVPGVEEVAEGEYHRALRIGDQVTALGVRWAAGAEGAGALLARASRGLGKAALRAAVVRLFDLAAPIGDFLRVAGTDPILGPLVRRRPGLRLAVYEDPFEGLVRALLGQQVSVAAARTLAGRLAARFGEPVPGFGGRALLAFPSARSLAAAPAGEIRAIGLTGAKAAALRGAAEAVAGGALDLERLRGAPPAAADAALSALPGVGPWTAAYVRMRGLGDRDAFPAGDLGVVKALSPEGGPRLGRREVERRAEAWRPFRAYATLHLWASLAD